MDEVLCADRRTEEQNKEDKDKGVRAKWKKYVRDAAIGGTFGGILGISTAIVAVVAAMGGRRSRRRTQRGHGHGERGICRGHRRSTRDAIKLERIRVKEEQRQTKLEREVEDTLVKAT